MSLRQFWLALAVCAVLAAATVSGDEPSRLRRVAGTGDTAPAGRTPGVHVHADRMSEPEVWLRGPVEHVAPLLQPVAHGLLQCRLELSATLPSLAPADLWARPGGAASVGYHLRHAVGSLDRLLTYARGE